jgi:Putative lumazine-binding
MTTDDRQAIEQTIGNYFDALYDGDADKLATVFHETAALTFEQKGAIAVLPLAQWLKMVRERPSGRAQGLARDDAILLLDQSGPTTAFVKVKCQLPPRHFTDYLNLLKLDGRWWIVQKIYATEMRGG